LAGAVDVGLAVATTPTLSILKEADGRAGQSHRSAIGLL
jgi:hypothetical protein